MVIEKIKQTTTQEFAGNHVMQTYKPEVNLASGASNEKIPEPNFVIFFKIKNLTNQIRAIFPLSYVYTRKHCLEVS